jgi:hypothetical protein
MSEEISRLLAEVKRLKARVITDEQIDKAWIIAEKPVEKLILKKLGIFACPECHGSGVVAVRSFGGVFKCDDCHGHGWIREERGDE